MKSKKTKKQTEAEKEEALERQGLDAARRRAPIRQSVRQSSVGQASEGGGSAYAVRDPCVESRDPLLFLAHILSAAMDIPFQCARIALKKTSFKKATK